jgi:hypothetical protein
MMQLNSNFAEVIERDGNLRLLGFGAIAGIEGGLGIFQYEGATPHQRILPLTHPRVQQMMFFGAEGFAKFMEAFAPKQPAEQPKQIEELAP